MPKIKFSVNTSRAERKFAKLEKLRHVVLRAVELRIGSAVESIERRLNNSETTSSLLARRSSALFKSIGFTTRKKGNETFYDVGVISNNPKVLQQAHTQELGATIRAVRAEKLAFPPMDVGLPIRGARGQQLLTVREAKTYFRMWKSRDGSVFLGVPKDSPGSDPRVLFIRKKQVTIPAREFIRPEREKMRKFLKEDLQVIVTNEMIHLGLK